MLAHHSPEARDSGGRCIGFHYCPPLLCLGISRHLRHVRLKVRIVVFPIAEQQIIFEKDGIIADIAISEHVQNLRPNRRMKFLVLLDCLRLYSDYRSVPFHWNSP
jgi:hypothetical protein